MNDRANQAGETERRQQKYAEERATDDGMPVVDPQRQTDHAGPRIFFTPKQRVSDARKRLGMGYLSSR
ncbi:hypothetical protein [Burkholderia oklahomensis]|uniref:Uncharacterized protein n=1 Tax=Burkholderia oklahomensis TaxID=342113 RepID=A0AAI8BAY9_9BURK|nr:hypothetical protein [Burkholderia oklahomensis]AIO68927.1 hypothetical protein DM82_3815 [Burkholderia oklahomensis]AJX34783.1 hypothetical protein BG90_4227 [Burkholderia oklahomensis C6786]AOI50106.1 hypothetical protein WI23_19085 [Burkholderia oklahomensis C6786]MBI0363871.1 hypothetical protein [Burkholderia oklahomensis]QPS41369.1 hypothetical protein I6G57_24470 [Burkholderia oklahomensis]